MFVDILSEKFKSISVESDRLTNSRAKNCQATPLPTHSSEIRPSSSSTTVPLDERKKNGNTLSKYVGIKFFE